MAWGQRCLCAAARSEPPCLWTVRLAALNKCRFFNRALLSRVALLGCSRQGFRCGVGHASLRSRARSVWRAAGMGRNGKESLAFGRARSAADICGFILNPRPHVQRRLFSAELSSSGHAVASIRVARKSVSLIHIRCRITASLRATAITARRWPRVFARRSPQAFSTDQASLRVIKA